MHITRQVALYFLIFIMIVLAGMGIVVNRIYAINVAHQRLAEEGKELRLSIDLFKEIDGLIVMTSKENSDLKSTLYWERIDRLADLMEDVRGNSTEPEDFEESSHVMTEENEFLDIRDDFDLFISISNDIRSGKIDPEFSRRSLLEELENLRRAGVKLQGIYMKSMAEASAYAQRARQQILDRTIIVFVVLLSLLAVFAAWFIYLVSENTKAMLEREKGMTIGLLAQSLAHEIRNPLGIIKSSASVIRDKLPENSEEQEIAGYLTEEVDRIDQLIGQLLQFSREGKTQMKAQSPRAMVEQVVALMRSVAQKNGISLELFDRAGDCQVIFDANQIKQVLINVILNAIQASEPGGRIEVSTGLAHKIYSITVRDYGHGFPKEALRKAYDSFYTTKESGLGLGLFVVRNIIQAHGGAVLIQPAEPKGTTVVINLKLNSKAV